MSDVILDTFEGFDFKAFYLPMITVYKSPKDYMGFYVGRLYDLDKPTKYVIVKDTTQLLNRAIPHYFEFIERDKNDDINILGVFV